MRSRWPGRKAAWTSFNPRNSLANALSARIIRTVGEPRRDVAAAKSVGNGNTLEDMIQSSAPDIGIRITNGSVLVFLVLKHVGIDRHRSDTALFCELLNFRHIAQTI